MGSREFDTFRQFKQYVCEHRTGPLISAVEDIADEMFQNTAAEEPGILWDAVDDEED